MYNKIALIDTNGSASKYPSILHKLDIYVVNTEVPLLSCGIFFSVEDVYTCALYGGILRAGIISCVVQ